MREGKLIASGARVDVRNNIGATALMFASMSARFEIVKIPLKHQGQGNEKMLRVMNKAHCPQECGLLIQPLVDAD